jgi:hypothetical protein
MLPGERVKPRIYNLTACSFGVKCVALGSSLVSDSIAMTDGVLYREMFANLKTLTNT